MSGQEPAAPDPEHPTAVDGERGDPESWLNLGVSSVGAASFFSDSGHEITTAVLPSFLRPRSTPPRVPSG